MTHICVAIAVDHSGDVDQALAALRRAHADGATMVEWRVDALAQEPDALVAIRRLIRESSLPCIVTIRGAREGGAYHGDESDRVSLLEALGTGDSSAPAYFDFELADFERSANVRQKILLAVQHAGQVRQVGARLILSAHDFQERPPTLTRMLGSMAATDACAVAKLVWRARSVRDNLEAFELLSARPKPMIALCMGEAGVMSRILAPKFGAFLTFARAGGPGDAEAAAGVAAGTAAGQPTVRQLVQEYGVTRVGAATRVYGVIGWPVAHSKSPATHNAWFARHGVDGVYVPIPVPPEYEHFKASVGALLDYVPLHFSGASVTLPHKEHLVRFVRERGGRVEPLAVRIGAANTLIVEPDGTLVCTNTDAAAAVDALRAAMANPLDLTDMRVAILGAGGVARAIAVGLADAGARVVVFNRTQAQAERLAQEVMSAEHPDEGVCGPMEGRVIAGRLEQIAQGDYHAFINCTPVGMNGGPAPQESPLPASVRLTPSTLVMDTVYTPRMTPLLQAAQQSGARIVDGWGMFMRQAARQFERWTNVRPEMNGDA